VHIVATFGSGEQTVYLNGRRVASREGVTWSPGPPSADATGVPGECVDDVRIYDRALTSSEARRLAATRWGRTAPELKGLVGRWWLNEEALRSEHKGPAWSGGRLGGGFVFDGSHDYVDCGAKPGSGDKLTVAFWMRPEGPGCPIAKSPGSDKAPGWCVLLEGKETRYALRFRVGGAGGARAKGDLAHGESYRPGEWVHVGCTFAGGTSTLYLDGDGVEDDGMSDGVNAYGIGVYEFLAKLRRRMGDDFIIQADGALGPGGVRSQRGAGIVNGIESEGFPDVREWDMDDWSGGLNRHVFWRENSRPPAFSYVNHKYNEPVPGKPGVKTRPDVGYNIHRLVFAACCFTDSMICYSFAPPADPDGRYGIWDEFRRGEDNRLGWLGDPEGPAVHLATRAPDLLRGAGRGRRLAQIISGPVDARVTDGGVVVSPRGGGARAVSFSIRGVPCEGPDMYVSVRMACAPLPGHPRAMPRFAKVGVSGGMTDLMASSPVETGIRLRGGREKPLARDTGASVRRTRAGLAGETRAAWFVHPPYKRGKGYTYWIAEADVPAATEDGGPALTFAIGMGPMSPERSDGVWFSVHAAEIAGLRRDEAASAAQAGGGAGKWRKLFEKSTKEHRWLAQRVPLGDLAGRRVRLKFVADCGPRDDATTDHAHWGDARIVGPAINEADITPRKSYMTWVGRGAMTSGFYFRDVRSRAVDIGFEVEGAAPVTVESVTAHARPDAMYRVFERGLVLANPSPRPYEFRLSELTPGRRYRRIKATARQDTAVNTGAEVGGVVRLGPMDALFLVRLDGP
jgi:hypothetical protein